MAAPEADSNDVAKMLADALDDFDGDEPNVTAPQPLPAAPPPAPMPTQLPPTAPATSSVGGEKLESLHPVSCVDSTDMQQADDLAKMLASSLSVGSTTVDDCAGSAGSGPADDDELEQTLRNLAASAEALVDKPADGNAAEDEAMLKLLQQLGAGLGGGSSDQSASDQGMMDLLQKLGAAAQQEDAHANGQTTRGTPVSSSAGSMGVGSSASTANGSSDDDAAMEGMLDQLVGQLLSKDVMLEPMRHLHAEFPRYLASHKESLSEQERSRYMQQQRLVGEILKAYEETPDDTDKVAMLMQQMQACGAPPAEIAGPVADTAGCILM